jgi:hypothetical protein
MQQNHATGEGMPEILFNGLSRRRYGKVIPEMADTVGVVSRSTKRAGRGGRLDMEGRKHVLAVREGASENAAAAKNLLPHLVEHGIDPARRRLFVIDGSKALRTAINAVFGAETPEGVEIINCALCSDDCRAAGTDRLADARGLEDELERWHRQVPPARRLAGARLSRGCLCAAGRLRRMLHINGLDVRRSLRPCLATSNVVESAFRRA